jgi:hypothetical protein
MVEAAGCQGFSAKTPPKHRVRHEIRTETLDGYRSPKVVIEPAEDLRHASSTEELEGLIAVLAGSLRRCHRFNIRSSLRS